jgi:hypothetical protein
MFECCELSKEEQWLRLMFNGTYGESLCDFTFSQRALI